VVTKLSFVSSEKIPICQSWVEKQELKLIFEDGAFFIRYYDFRFPVRPKTYTSILEHRIDDLKNIIPEDNLHYVELLSIITALKHLPPYTETDTEKISERYREKEIIKKRLWNLYSVSQEIKTFIDENIQIFNGVKDRTTGLNLLDGFLRQQVYRLSHWRVATEEINYRRFFDINDLAAIRMEDQTVFKKAHKLIFKLVKDRKITGIRVDHPDGLYNPPEYFHSLQKSCFLWISFSDKRDEQSDTDIEAIKKFDEMISSDPHYKPFYIIGEKILTKGEKMPEDWPIFGTTGYSFMNSLNSIFIDTKNAKAFDDIYTKFTRTKTSFQDIVYEKKKLIMHASMASELNTLSHYLNRISEEDKHTRDFTLYSLTTAIKEVISCFPVYRTYINSYSIHDSDRKYIEHAVSKAKRKNPAVSESIFDFLKNVLLLNFPEYFGDNDRKEWLDFVMRFQQITGPVMAKGLEDTAFYIYNRLVSLNEVGGDPERFGISLEAFHGQNIDRNKLWPHSMIATSTHDSKRSEDVRARVNVLSEIPDEWRKCLIRWSRMNKKKKPLVNSQMVPDRNEEYLLYQTLIGAWQFDAMNESEYEIFKKRIKDYIVKALREAKVNTSWINPNADYEDALLTFVEGIMGNKPGNQFLNDFKIFQKKISHYGMYNSLSQTLLKITCPGVPDFYQGTDLWNLNLVDPDNRRPVDFEKRARFLREIKAKEAEGALNLFNELLLTKEDGRVKLFLIYKSLAARQQNRELFEKGSYIPVEAGGRYKANIVAFARECKSSWAITIAPRFFTGVIKEDEYPVGEKVWDDTHIVLPEDTPSLWHDAIIGDSCRTGQTPEGKNTLTLGKVLKCFSVALLIGKHG
jgi:(1->4)-alpha-D-glucan 1-alpha-D-glucosylmutase